MAVKMRLKRMGATKKPYYRIVVSDSRSPRDGKNIEEIGTYDPLREDTKVTIKEDRVQYWLGVGAQPTDTVRNLLSQTGSIKKFHESKKGNK